MFAPVADGEPRRCLPEHRNNRPLIPIRESTALVYLKSVILCRACLAASTLNNHYINPIRLKLTSRIRS
jgi:hypothetical protein